jgi:hypothetical protein
MQINRSEKSEIQIEMKKKRSRETLNIASNETREIKTP